MRQNFILVFILLVTFSMVGNAKLHKRTTNFNACPLSEPTPTLGITLSPDPIVPGSKISVTFTGKLNVDLGDGDIVDVPFLDENFIPIIDPWFTVNLCEAKGIKCPIPSGTEFTGTAENIQVPSDADLPKGSTIVVDITDETQNFLACSISDPLK